MNTTLLDEQGVELTEITSHLGRLPGQMLVDRATRPEALFQYYFDRGRRAVTLVTDAERYTALLDTRWQMRVRFWFLREFLPVGAPAPAVAQALGAGDNRGTSAVWAAEDLRAPAAVGSTSEPRGVPA